MPESPLAQMQTIQNDDRNPLDLRRAAATLFLVWHYGAALYPLPERRHYITAELAARY